MELFKKKESSGAKDREIIYQELPQQQKGEIKLKRKLSLPKNFAKKVIHLESVCERPDVTLLNVKELMDLYTVYSSIPLTFS